MPLCFIALLPPEPLREQVREIKEEISDKYRSKRALRLPAHITLQPPFIIEEDLVPKLHAALKEFAGAQRPVEIHLSGFGAFVPRVIFIEVTRSSSLKELQKQLLEDLQKHLFIKEESSREFHPHITLATRDLTRSNFKMAWEEFRHRDFTASFKVKGLYLFQHNGKTWDIHREFQFGN